MALATSRFVVSNIHKNIALETSATNVVQPGTTIKQAVAFHPVILNTSVARKIFTPIISIPVTFVNPPIPDASTQSGNLFNDRFDKNIKWYLPTFNLLAGTDTGFSFIASTTSLPDDAGNPFYIANLKFTIRKEVPPNAMGLKSGIAPA